MKGNLGALKEQIKKQNLAVMNGDKESGLANANSTAQQGVYGHINNIKKNMDNIMGNLAGFKEMCQAAFQNYMQGRKQIADQMAKKNEKTAEFCGRVAEMNTMPGCENADVFDSVISAAREAGGGQSGEVANATAWRSFCKSRGDSNTDSVTAAIYRSRNNNTSVLTACKEKPEVSSCTAVINFDKYCNVTDSTLKEPGLAKIIEAGNTDFKDKCLTQDGTVKSGTTKYTPPGGQESTCIQVAKDSTKCDFNDLQASYNKVADAAAKELTTIKATSGSQNITAQFDQFRESRNMGENKNSMCSAFDNSGNSVGKTVLDTFSNVMKAAVPGQTPSTVLGQ
jgi:hypothetical protein